VAERRHAAKPAATDRAVLAGLPGMSMWSSVAAPGVVSASVTALIYVWLQRPRAHLEMLRINQTEEVAKWLVRAEGDKDPDAVEAKKLWQPRDIVLLRNSGDGTAYDIRFSGDSNCRPRVWVRNVGHRDTEDAPVVAGMPMWVDRLASLGPGQSWSVVVMSRTDPTLPRPVLEVSYSVLPRRGLRRKKAPPLDLANANIIETGWPGKTNITN
jgi:hypothetical protein